MMELSTMRAAVHSAKPLNMQATSQTVAPAASAPHNTRRPWNRRAAFQIIPQEMNSSAFANPAGSGGVEDAKVHPLPCEWMHDVSRVADQRAAVRNVALCGEATQRERKTLADQPRFTECEVAGGIELGGKRIG